MKNNKDIIISKLNGKIGALLSQNVRLKQRISKLKKQNKIEENEELRKSLNNMTAIHGRLLKKLKRKGIQC